MLHEKLVNDLLSDRDRMRRANEQYGEALETYVDMRFENRSEAEYSAAYALLSYWRNRVRAGMGVVDGDK